MTFKSKKHAVINKKYCVACGCCITECPVSAIYINHGSFAVVDDTKCVGCGKCSIACPASVITIEVRK